MDEKQKREVAANLDATPEMLPYLDELLADLSELGCSLELIVEVLHGMEVTGDPPRALDLACGKGAVALRLAQDLGYTVEGVDLYEPFIEDARRHARELGLDEHCRFRAVDMRQAIAESDGVDLVIYSSVGALGEHDRAIALLRQAVRPGGLVLIDDGFVLSPEAARRAGYEHYAGLEETRRRLESCGDRIVLQRIIEHEEQAEDLDSDTESIRRRARDLAERVPEAAELARRFVELQEEECAFLEESFVSALWVVRRSQDG